MRIKIFLKTKKLKILRFWKFSKTQSKIIFKNKILFKKTKPYKTQNYRFLVFLNNIKKLSNNGFKSLNPKTNGFKNPTICSNPCVKVDTSFSFL